jgi:predicted nucleotide-binding protein (sugar kinase/HSP70/actin superfamily)
VVADDPRLQLVQIVSFGCGHDAILSDEVTRLMRERSGKTPLVLKLDEGDNRGPVGIRVRSFVGSLRALGTRTSTPLVTRETPERSSTPITVLVVPSESPRPEDAP